MWDAGLLWVAGGLDSGHFLLGWKIGVGGVAGLDCGTRSGWDVKGSEMGCGTRSGWDVKVFGSLNSFSMGGWGMGDVGLGIGE